MSAASTIPLSVPNGAGRTDRPLGVVYLEASAWVPLTDDAGRPLYDRDPDSEELYQRRLESVTGRIALKASWLSVTELVDWLPGVTELLLPPQSVVRVEMIG